MPSDDELMRPSDKLAAVLEDLHALRTANASGTLDPEEADRALDRAQRNIGSVLHLIAGGPRG